MLDSHFKTSTCHCILTAEYQSNCFLIIFAQCLSVLQIFVFIINTRTIVSTSFPEQFCLKSEPVWSFFKINVTYFDVFLSNAMAFVH